MDCQVSVTNSQPNIYKIDLTSFPEVCSTFTDEIIQCCSCSNLDSTLVDYITSVVDPVGWKAVWRSSKETAILNMEYDFIVEVVNVSLEKLEAEVFIQSIIAEDSNKIQRLKEKLQLDNFITVPLTELYVISEDDEEEMYEKTAIAIEHIRFFLKNVYRAWDGEDDTVYTEEVLRSRLQLYFDMKNNLLPKTMSSKIKTILREGTRIQKELNKLYSDLHVSDSETEINEDEVMHSLSLKKKLEKLKTKMEMLENPVIRAFVSKKFSPSKTLKKPPKSNPVVYVVSKSFTRDMISQLSIDSNEILEFEHNPEAAFKHSSAGDKIFIFPGVYTCDTLGWLESDILVQGIGTNTDIVLEATGNSDVLLNSCAHRVELQNVTLKAKAELLSALVVHHGKVELRNCIVNSNEAEIGLLLLGGSEAVLENTIISNASEDGVQMRSLSSLSLKSSRITFSERNGILIDAENEVSPDSFTDLNIVDSQVTDNGEQAIFLCNVPISEISLQRPSGGFNILKLFPWLRYQIEGTVFDRNGDNGVGIASSYQKQNFGTVDSTVKGLSEDMVPDELNYSALSDLLNEVNLSIDQQELIYD